MDKSTAAISVNWHRAAVTIQTSTDGPREFYASVCRGLAVHHTICDGGLQHEAFWSVTHLASSKVIVPTHLERVDAFAFARALLAVGDWTRAEGDIQGLREGTERVRKEMFG